MEEVFGECYEARTGVDNPLTLIALHFTPPGASNLAGNGSKFVYHAGQPGWVWASGRLPSFSAKAYDNGCSEIGSGIPAPSGRRHTLELATACSPNTSTNNQYSRTAAENSGDENVQAELLHCFSLHF